MKIAFLAILVVLALIACVEKEKKESIVGIESDSLLAQVDTMSKVDDGPTDSDDLDGLDDSHDPENMDDIFEEEDPDDLLYAEAFDELLDNLVKAGFASGDELTNYTEKGLAISMIEIQPHEQEIGATFQGYASISNVTKIYSPEAPHELKLKVDPIVRGAIARVDNENEFGLDPGKTHTVGLGVSFGVRIFLTCTEKGIGSFSVTATTESPNGETYDVVGEVTVNCVTPPTPTPRPTTGRTAELQTLVINGQHYYIFQFTFAGANENGCQQRWLSPKSHHFTSPSSGDFVLVPGAMISFENPQSPSLIPQGECGFGVAEDYLPESMYLVDLALFEEFCERYAEETVPPGIEPEEIFNGSSEPTICVSNLRYLRREP